MVCNIDDFGTFVGVESGGGISSVSGSLCFTEGYINSVKDASGPAYAEGDVRLGVTGLMSVQSIYKEK